MPLVDHLEVGDWFIIVGVANTVYGCGNAISGSFGGRWLCIIVGVANTVYGCGNAISGSLGGRWLCIIVGVANTVYGGGNAISGPLGDTWLVYNWRRDEYRIWWLLYH